MLVKASLLAAAAMLGVGLAGAGSAVAAEQSPTAEINGGVACSPMARYGDSLVCVKTGPNIVTESWFDNRTNDNYTVRLVIAETGRGYYSETRKFTSFAHTISGMWRGGLRNACYQGAVYIYDRPGLPREFWSPAVCV